MNQVKSECEAKLILANDNYIVIKTENEVLKEKVDVLFKLGRSYLNKSKLCNKNSDEENKDEVKENEEKNKDDHIEVIEEDDDIQSLQAWTKSKMRGFKKVNPTAQPRPNAETGCTRQPSSEPSSSAQKSPSTRPPSAATGSLPPDTASTTTTTENQRFQPERIQYCHYFSNFGKCHFEERTGTPCRFVHGSAPICQSGTACM